jgi:hypothetical protein
VRWLRPEFQAPDEQKMVQRELIAGTAVETPATKAAKRAWPKAMPEQFKALKAALAEQPAPVASEGLARTFKRAQSKKVAELLEILAALGQARQTEDGRYTAD